MNPELYSYHHEVARLEQVLADLLKNKDLRNEEVRVLYLPIKSWYDEALEELGRQKKVLDASNAPHAP